VTVCAATNCIETVQKGHLMCRGHWFEVPPQLRIAIINHQRRHESGNYGRSVRAAIEHIEGIENVFSEPFSSGQHAPSSPERPKAQEAGLSGSQPPVFIVLPHLGTAS
jgi:hypothetical protein